MISVTACANEKNSIETTDTVSGETAAPHTEETSLQTSVSSAEEASALHTEENTVQTTVDSAEETTVLHTEETSLQTAAASEAEISTDITEINDELKNELLDMTDCFLVLQRLASGEFYHYTDIVEHDLGAEYGENHSEIVTYNAFELRHGIFDKYQDTFFRSDGDIDFSSDSSAEDFTDIARLYMTDEFIGNNLKIFFREY
ncbi:MAG: hypothetical protein NC120_09460, partial [Ruminococcus sp.]|nr:hypothetical protein [Ruminococcus sp.]